MLHKILWHTYHILFVIQKMRHDHENRSQFPTNSNSEETATFRHYSYRPTDGLYKLSPHNNDEYCRTSHKPIRMPSHPKNRRSSSSQPISHFIILFVEKTLTQAAQIRSQIKNKRTKTYEKRQAQNGDLFIL